MFFIRQLLAGSHSTHSYIASGKFELSSTAEPQADPSSTIIHVPTVLEFSSWWSETVTMRRHDGGGSTFARHTISIVFNTEDGSCEVWLQCVRAVTSYPVSLVTRIFFLTM